MTEQTLSHWLALWRVPGVGPRHFRRALEHVGRLDPLFDDPAFPWTTLDFSPEQQDQLRAHARQAHATLAAGVQQDLDWMQRSPHHHILTWNDPRYPALLREIRGAPPVLFVRGDPGCLALPQIAIVGSRQSTRAGQQLAGDFARHFSRCGFITTSGLALGIDSAAHAGALDGGGLTLAVLAHGLDAVYPPRNRTLAEQVVERGALVSEFPVGVQPRPEFFPRRNRIISGLSLGVLVVEAALKSGSLITAHEAIDQGREVFAIPGSIHNPLARGCHALIRNGAKLVETAEQVVEELQPLLGFMQQQWRALPDPADSAVDPASGWPTGSAEGRLLAALEYEVCSVDKLVELTGLTAAEVSSTLLLLELEGCVQPEQGGYCRT